MGKKKNKTEKRVILRRLCLVLAGVLLFCAHGMIGCRIRVQETEYPFHWQGTQPRLQGEYACILVPGAAVKGGAPETHLQDRLDTAVTLYKAGVSDTILLSGGYNEEQEVWESRVMMAYLDQQGIPRAAMVLDDYGIDTAETLRRTKAWAGDKKVIICTQSLYADRTAYLAQCYDLESEIADSDIRIYTVGTGKAQVREFFAATKAVYDGIFIRDCRYSMEEHPMKGGHEYA